MEWRKLGMVYVPDGSRWWARRRAYLPTPQILDGGGIIRVFYSGLDSEWVGRIGCVDLDAEDPTRILHDYADPVLDVGGRGEFDEHGVTPSCLLKADAWEWLFYYGWQRVVGVPPLMFTGLARRPAAENMPFARFYHVPLLDRTHQERLARAGSFILQDFPGYRMWYNARSDWLDLTDNPLYGKEEAIYDIRYMESGLVWDWAGASIEMAVTFKDPDEFGLARPWVVKDPDMYRMWYGIRCLSQPYRIGYAESPDGYVWERRDGELSLGRSEDGWDSEMVSFPAVVDAAGKRYMFYNGNQHGETGFGVAVLE